MKKLSQKEAYIASIKAIQLRLPELKNNNVEIEKLQSKNLVED